MKPIPAPSCADPHMVTRGPVSRVRLRRAGWEGVAFDSNLLSVSPAVNSVALGKWLRDFVMARSCAVLPGPEPRDRLALHTLPARAPHSGGPVCSQTLVCAPGLHLVEPWRAHLSPVACRVSLKDSEGKEVRTHRNEEHGKGKKALQREQAEGTQGWPPAAGPQDTVQTGAGVGGRREMPREKRNRQCSEPGLEFEQITSGHVTDLLDEKETLNNRDIEN